MLQVIPTKVHGIIDYTMSAFMGSSPLFLNGMKDNTSKKSEGKKKKKVKLIQMIPFTMSAVSGLYSMFTNYELGLVKKIPMKVHLALDAASGVLMAAAPWLFGFSKKVWIPFVAMGAFEVAAALLTQSEPQVVEENFDV